MAVGRVRQQRGGSDGGGIVVGREAPPSEKLRVEIFRIIKLS